MELSTPVHTPKNQFPEKDPHWDLSDDRDCQKLKQYQEAVISGMQEGRNMAMNMAQNSEVLKGPEDSPVLYCKRQGEAFRLCSIQKHQKTSRWLMLSLSVKPRETLGKIYRSFRVLLGRTQAN